MKVCYIYTEEEDNIYRIEKENKKSEVNFEDFPGALMRLIEAGYTVYMWNAGLFLHDIIVLLKKEGYTPVRPDAKIKEMAAKTYRPLITGDFDLIKCDIRVTKKKTAHIINADRITQAHDTDLIKEVQRYGSAKRPQTTMPSICMYAWQRWGKNTPFTVKQTLPDAKKMHLDGENVTVEEYCRKAYHGGYVRNKAGFAAKKEDVYVYDYNKLYASIMHDMPLPVGIPTECQGEPDELIKEMTGAGKIYYYIHLKTKLRIKKGGVKCIKLRYDDPQRLTRERDFLTTSETIQYDRRTFKPYKGEDTQLDLYLTCTDHELLLENYNLFDTEYISYVWFVTDKDNSLFKSYVEYFFKMATESEGVKKQTGKNFNNFLSGSLAKSQIYENTIISYENNSDDDDPIIKELVGDREYYTTTEETESSAASYIYVGAAITAYGRKKILGLAKNNYKKWEYTDTDSVHFDGTQDGLDIGDGLGQLKVEHHFDKVWYYSKKRYIGIEHDTQKIDGAFSGLCQVDKDDLYNVLQKLYDGWKDNPEWATIYCDYKNSNDMYIGKEKEPVDMRWYKWILDECEEWFGGVFQYDFCKIMENLPYAKIKVSQRYTENFKINREYKKIDIKDIDGFI